MAEYATLDGSHTVRRHEVDMDLFASDDRVALLDARLAAYGPQAPVALQLELAWYLRQRDVSRALKLTSAVEAGLPPGDGMRAGPRRGQ